MARKLKPIQRKILQTIIKYMEENDGRSPTNREIGEKVISTPSPSSGHIAYHLKILEEEGYIQHETGMNRSIRVLKDEQGLPYERMGVQRDRYSMPVHGTVAAGEPLIVSEIPADTLELIAPRHTADVFGLKVQGNSMIDIGIYNGDYILAERDTYIENGDVVIATHCMTGEATVKRFYKEKGKIKLKPENTTMTPIHVDALEWDDEWRVQGKLKAVIHLFA
jgi:repressor LexA